MGEMFGGLFTYDNPQKLEDFVKSVSKEEALKLIELSLDYSQQNGQFSLEESYLIYSMLNKIKQ